MAHKAAACQLFAERIIMETHENATICSSFLKMKDGILILSHRIIRIDRARIINTASTPILCNT